MRKAMQDEKRAKTILILKIPMEESRINNQLKEILKKEDLKNEIHHSGIGHPLKRK